MPQHTMLPLWFMLALLTMAQPLLTTLLLLIMRRKSPHPTPTSTELLMTTPRLTLMLLSHLMLLEL